RLRRRGPSYRCAGGSLGGGRRKRDLYLESALGSGVQLERAVVRGGDRGDDREPEAVSVLRACPVGSEACEWFGEPRDHARVQDRAAALDDEQRAFAAVFERDGNRPVWLVMAHGVLDYVVDHPRQQGFASGDANRGEASAHPDVFGGDRLAAPGERVVRELGERYRRGVELGVLGARKREEVLEQPVGL